MLTKAALQKLAPWLEKMAEKPLRHPDGSLEISIKSFEQLKPRSETVTWVLGTKFAEEVKVKVDDIKDMKAQQTASINNLLGKLKF